VRRPDTGWLYVTCPLDGRVVVVDPDGGATIATLMTGGRPRRPSWDPATSSVIVPNESGWVDIIR
jgi:DNA-binding beta-propeller fold protein YncE